MVSRNDDYLVWLPWPPKQLFQKTKSHHLNRRSLVGKGALKGALHASSSTLRGRASGGSSLQVNPAPLGGFRCLAHYIGIIHRCMYYVVHRVTLCNDLLQVLDVSISNSNPGFGFGRAVLVLDSEINRYAIRIWCCIDNSAKAVLRRITWC